MTPADFPRARRAWRAITEAATVAARSPADDVLARDLRAELRGLTAGGFPLEAGDVRARAVDAFLVLGRFWAQAGAETRTAFAASLSGLAGDLNALLHSQATGEAQRDMERQGHS